MDEWQPNAEDLRNGQEAYIRYLGGVAIINDPWSPFARGIHQRQDNPEDLLTIVNHAELLIYRGLQKVITFANPPDHRRNMIKTGSRFNEALPNMRKIIDTTCSDFAERLDAINPALRLAQPAPILDRYMYGHFAHCRLYKIGTRRLLGGLLPAVDFESILAGRTLATTPHQFQLKQAG